MLILTGSAETDVRWGGNLVILMASCVLNIHTKNI